MAYSEETNKKGRKMIWLKQYYHHEFTMECVIVWELWSKGKIIAKMKPRRMRNM
jgi:hypothetical protein